MITRILLIAELCLSCFSVGAEKGVPSLQVRERVAPWGTVVQRMHYYVKDGKRVQHGLDESFSPDGMLERRLRYSHGKEDGVYEFFYDGIGMKRIEMSYAAGEPHGHFRTWAADGKLLFEGTYKDGKEWDGWFEQGSTSSSGVFHRKSEKWKIVQRKNGKKVQGSGREVETSWQTWPLGKLPDPKLFIRWNWSQFAGKSNYPYMDRMPKYSDVPFLIKCFEEKGEGYQEATDQLQALTRVQFGNPWLQTDPERSDAAAKWRAWWKDVGKQRPELQTQRGVREEKAWNLAQKGRNLPMPEEAQVIPEIYVLEVHFRSGDYGGVIIETLTIQRHRERAELTRRFSTRQNGPVTEERWVSFGVEDADRVVRAVGYLIDRPWLLNDEADIEKRYWTAEKKDPKRESLGKWCDDKLKGRESYGPPYYPNATFELRDAGGKIWWNADPDRWYGGNPERFNQTHQLVPGTVFPFLAALYPESTRSDGSEKPGWAAR